MKVWIDLANSPHALFFAPIVQDLEASGHEVLITAREFAQTVELARMHGLSPQVIGRHAGKSLPRKLRTIAVRSRDLYAFARKFQPEVAVSHGSYALAIAARMRRLRSITIMDYEHTPANHLSFRMASTVVLPSAIGFNAVRRYGATRRKTVFYNGFKEQVYLDSFIPDRSKVDDILPPGMWDERVVAVARPPADFAVYHRFENPLFEQWVATVGSNDQVAVIVLPRTDEQRRRLDNLDLPSVVICDRPVDGANLIHAADLVVSAGGTMNREAAVMGVPAYSIFASSPAAVDLELNRRGRLEFIRDAGDLARIQLRKNAGKGRLENPTLRREIADLIVTART
jgi:predicted glycosyltransferase